MARDLTRIIHALAPKLQAIGEVLFEKKAISAASLRALSGHAKINYETLKSAKKNGILSSTNEDKLAKAAGFSQEDSTWVDTSVDPKRRSRAEGTDYPGADTISAFRRALRLAHGLPAEYFVRINATRAELLDSNLAILHMSDCGQQTASDQTVPIFLSIILECGYHESGLSFGFGRVRLKIRPENPSTRLNNCLGGENEIRVANAKLTSRGAPFFPEWLLVVTDAPVLQGEYEPKEPLCEIAEIKLGEFFDAELSVRLMDGSLQAREGGELPSKIKQAIIRQLFAESLRNKADTQGWLTLGTQRLHVVRADQL